MPKSLVRAVCLLLTCATVTAATERSSPAAASPEGSLAARWAQAYQRYFDAQQLAQQGRSADARRQLEQAVALDPEAPAVRSLLARLCLQNEDSACAEKQAKEALARDPRDAEAHRVLAEVALTRYRSGDQAGAEEAVAQWRQVVEAEPQDVTTWVNLIRLLGSAGRVDEAEVAAERAAGTPGVDPIAPWMSLARVLVARGENERAIKQLEKVRASGRASVPLLETLADLQAGRTDLAGQESTLQELRRLKREDPVVAHRLGTVRLELGDPFGALEPLQAAFAAKPDDPLIRRELARNYVKLGRGAQAIPLLEALPEVYRTSHALALWAQAAEQMGDATLAAQKLEDLLAQLAPKDRASLGRDIRVRAARNWMKGQKPGRALQVTEGLPLDAPLLRLRLSALDALGRTTEAARALATQRVDHPDDAGLLAIELDRLAAHSPDSVVVESAQSALGRFSQRPRAVADLAGWLVAFERAAVAGRILDAEGLPQDAPPDLLRARAVALSAAGRNGEAEAALRILLSQDPDNDALMNDLGFILASEGRSLDEAVRMLERAVARKPEEPAYLDSLGWALHRSGRSTDALTYLQRAARRAVERDEPGIRDHLGDVYLALGNAPRAVAEWQAALGLGFDPPARLVKKIEAAQKAPAQQ